MLYYEVFTRVLLPILVLMGFGWLIDRRFHLELATLVKINIYLLVPAFIFHQVITSSLDSGQAIKIVLFALTMIAGMGIMSTLVARGLKYELPQTRSLQLATMFYNSGNFGIPLVTLAFPGTGPLLQVFVLLTQNVSTFTVGLALTVSTHRSGWRMLLPVLRQVSIWAVAGALILRWQHVPVTEWRWLWVPVEYLNNALVGFALLTLGVQLSQAKPGQSVPRISWALGLRLIGGPLVACLLVPLFGFHGEVAAVMILSSSFPTAVNTALLAHEFKGDSHFAAAVVFYSTLFGIITVTLLIVLLQSPLVVFLCSSR
jgi:predicted permease